ncbi:sugar porter family MFS transporter [Enterococcus hirae]|nr:sugar porter family MFS transporter [Enterococcus hirae]
MAQTNKNRLKQIAAIVTIAALLFGYNTAVVNGSLQFIVKDLGITSFQKGIVSSALTLSAAFGAVFGGAISDKIGRKKTLRWIAWIFLIGAAGCGLSVSYSLLVASRFFLGLAVGSASAVVPLYLGEIASPDQRGKMVGLNQIMIVGGQFLAFLINAILGNVFMGNVHIWKVMMGLAALPAIVMLIGMTKVLESPKWLAKNGKLEAAITVIKSIYSDDAAQREGIKELGEFTGEVQVESKGKEKIPGWALKVLFIGCLLGIVQQFAGINAIMYYGSEILNKYGFSESASLIFNVLNGVICVVASTVGASVVDRMGRKKLENIGLGVCAAALVLAALLSNILAGQSFTPYIILILVFIYIFAFQGAVGPVTWILISEIFPAKFRGSFSGISVFVLWIANFCVGLFFPVLVETVGINATFYGFAVCAVIGIVIVSTMVPETKGKTLVEIEEYFRTKG